VRAPVIVCALVALGCSGSTNSSSGATGGAQTSLPLPVEHRASAQPCTAERPPVNAGAMSMEDKCDKDSDCTKGKNGRCVRPFPQNNICSYDECTEDKDCGASRACACRLQSEFSANKCFFGNCVVDADCGSGGYCSPSAIDVPSNCRMDLKPGSIGYFRHTAKDECTNKSDCKGDRSYCIFSADVLHWVCFNPTCTK
jgi:hypothetical protein